MENNRKDYKPYRPQVDVEGPFKIRQINVNPHHEFEALKMAITCMDEFGKYVKNAYANNGAIPIECDLTVDLEDKLVSITPLDGRVTRIEMELERKIGHYQLERDQEKLTLQFPIDKVSPGKYTVQLFYNQRRAA